MVIIIEVVVVVVVVVLVVVFVVVVVVVVVVVASGHWTARAITHGQNSFELTEKSFLIDGKMCWIAGANTHV